MPGGGNHRGSIFRLHVGTALLESGEWSNECICSWGVGITANESIRKAEYPLEIEVSRRIGWMPFLWLPVDDEPGPGSDRGVIESGAISLLSNLNREVIDPPSRYWLGLTADRQSVRESGLWNVDHTQSEPDEGFLDIFEGLLKV
jgi:hypothetical protein